jgi:hypothetical protein
MRALERAAHVDGWAFHGLLKRLVFTSVRCSRSRAMAGFAWACFGHRHLLEILAPQHLVGARR